jgi:hypothetical protein
MASSLIAISLISMSQAEAAKNIKICWEAETTKKITKPLLRAQLSNDSNASKGKYLQMPWSKDHLLGAATYRFNVVNSGKYYVFLRVKWSNSFSNIVYASINNSPKQYVGEDGTYGSWHWLGLPASVRCRSGTNTLLLNNMDMGVKIDQIFLCSEKNYTPTGKRRATQ